MHSRSIAIQRLREAGHVLAALIGRSLSQIDSVTGCIPDRTLSHPPTFAASLLPQMGTEPLPRLFIVSDEPQE
jgi:hypothetical protein